MDAGATITATFTKSAPPPPPAGSCSTALTNQGTPYEVISSTMCSGGLTFNALRFQPQGGNTFTNQFAENGQANCSIQPPYVICLFPQPTGTSGNIDLQGMSTPTGITVWRSTDGGATWQPASWTSTGP
jgi:hypothetical protein